MSKGDLQWFRFSSFKIAKVLGVTFSGYSDCEHFSLNETHNPILRSHTLLYRFNVRSFKKSIFKTHPTFGECTRDRLSW